MEGLLDDMAAAQIAGLPGVTVSVKDHDFPPRLKGVPWRRFFRPRDSTRRQAAWTTTGRSA